ncbi:MAG: invasin domain 3-containing protein [Myxococcaceae bacterium]
MSRVFHRLLLAMALGIALPSLAASFDVKPAQFQLGKDSQATVSFKGFSENPERLRSACSAGELRNVRAVGSDVVAEWSANKQMELQNVLCVVLSPSGAYALGIIPLVRKETLTLTALPPLSRVEVQVGTEHFGPVRADGEGRAELSVTRTASAPFAEVKATPPTGAPVTLRQPFSRAQTEQTLLFSYPDRLVADGSAQVTLHAFALSLDGALLEDPALVAQTQEGNVTLRRASSGVFIGTWTPSPRAADEDASISLKGRAAKTRVRLVAGIKAAASLHVREPVLPADGLSMTVVIARVTDATGRPLPQQPLKIAVDRGQIGNVTDRGDGTYVAPFTAPAGVAAMVKVRAELGGSTIAEASIRLVQGAGLAVEPLDPMLPADGTSQTILRISARDARGLPLKDGTIVKLSATLGDVPDTTTLQDGRADVLYKAGTAAGAAVITVTVGELSQTAAVQLVPGTPTNVEVKADPDKLSCTQQATLKVTVKDRYGNEVPEADVQLAVAKGSLSPVEAYHASFISRLTPSCVASAEDVQVEANVGQMRASTTVQVQPKSYDLAVRAALGAQSDLSSQTLGALGVELELPMPGLDRMRGGVELNAATGTSGQRRASLYSLYLGPQLLLVRADRLFVSGGAGLDGHLAAVEGARGALLGMHARLLAGFHAGPGDIVAQLRGTMPLTMLENLPSPAGADLSVGYRMGF